MSELSGSTNINTLKEALNKMEVCNLSAVELEILEWVREGKSNSEIGTIIGKTQWAVKYHMASIMKKLSVCSRTQAVSQAISWGMMDPESTDTSKGNSPCIHVGIVGCGSGGEAVLNILKENPSIIIEGVAEADPHAPGLKLVRKEGIPVLSDLKKLVSKKLDVIIDLTGSKDAAAEILKLKQPGTELMGGISAMLMWQLADERRKREKDKEKVLREHEALYHLGLIIESIDSINDAASAVVDYATKLLGMPAGSMAIYDEKLEVMRLVASKGFSDDFKKVDEWSLRKGGVTAKIFNASGPIFIPDLREESSINPLLLKEGARSALIAPLLVEGKIIGALYINDFKKRLLRAEDISIFSIISVYAALTIERVKSIEDMRMLSIVDGLTSLFNHRYMMEQLQKEYQRSFRHGTVFSVIMLDIDKFKPYNDNYGHLEGNKVLREMASIFRKGSRVTDVVGRFGGEEFCIIVPEMGREATVIFAEKLLKDVAAHSFPNREITLSAGVATYKEDGDSPMALLERADEYLYKAKHEGRNRVCSSLSSSA
ncbi:MAG: diguanylate cyclase [bacterium]|nr:diguanylate cyclase [bacterium]